MIEVENIKKSFQSVKALVGASFNAEDGQVTGLLGPNGAGKTTLLRILCTILSPDSGRATIDGKDVTLDPIGVAKIIGALPHVHGLYERLTSREHVRYYGSLHGLRGTELETRIESLIETLDMEDIADRRTAGFSRGQTLKVAVARALVHDPQNILLDEPTAGLDVMSNRKMRELIRQLRDQGRCVLLSTHVMHEASELCDRVVFITKGKVSASGSLDEIREATGHHDLEDAFLAAIGIDQGLVK